MKRSSAICGILASLLLTACASDNYDGNSRPEAGITSAADDIIIEELEETEAVTEASEAPAPDEDESTEDNEEEEKLFNQGLVVASKDGKDGYIDKTGRWVIEPQFDTAYDFSSCGLAVVYNDEKYGCIDMDGNYIFNGFKTMEHCFSNDGTIVAAESNYKYGLLDKTGEWIIEPQYDMLDHFNKNGIAEAAMYDPDDYMNINLKYGWIDRTGSFILEPQFDYIADFSQGLARVQTNGFDDPKYGYINKKGEIAIKPEYSYAEDFNEHGFARVMDADGNIGAIDTKGNIVIDLKYELIGEFAKNGLASAILTYGDEIGFIDKTGEWVIEPRFWDVAWGFSENGLASAAVLDSSGNKKWGYIDESGSWVIEPQFDQTYPFNKNDLAVISIFEGDKEKYGVIDKSGAIIAEPKYDYIGYYTLTGELPNTDLIEVGINDETGSIRFGYLDLNGNEVLEVKYIYIRNFAKNGLAAVSIGPSYDEAKYGFIDRTGNWVIVPQFDRAFGFDDDGYCIVQKDRMYGIIDSTGNYIIEPVFESIAGTLVISDYDNDVEVTFEKLTIS
ncbi:MAG: WG repeat-containing protein [Oscillospiraceae bacterium]|nr:WG repeat-containing protein [Oscillospiraceae bacterium]